MIKHLKWLPYEKWLNLEKTDWGGGWDMTEVYGTTNGKERLSMDQLLTIFSSTRTSGHDMELVRARLNKQQEVFLRVVVTELWKSLPEDVMDARSLVASRGEWMRT